MTTVAVAELHDVRKEYLLGETKVEALKGISLTIEKGEFTAIAGPSGSGKSTILNMIEVPGPTPCSIRIGKPAPPSQ